MKMKDDTLKHLREIMAVLSDTEIEIVAGNMQPQYVMKYGPHGNKSGPVYTIGIKWLEQHHPDAFAEVLKARLFPTA